MVVLGAAATENAEGGLAKAFLSRPNFFLFLRQNLVFFFFFFARNLTFPASSACSAKVSALESTASILVLICVRFLFSLLSFCSVALRFSPLYHQQCGDVPRPGTVCDVGGLMTRISASLLK